MVETHWLYLIMDVVGAALLGIAIAYGLVITARRKRDPDAQDKADVGTHQVYDKEEKLRKDREP